MDLDTHCFFHSADLDGHCSGAIVREAYPDAIMHPINYGEPFPWDELGPTDTVFMVDFSLSPEELLRLDEHVGHFIWIDHHKTAIEAWRDRPGTSRNVGGIRDTKTAACFMCWEHFNPMRPMPAAVKHCSLYDIWDHRIHDTLSFQFGLRSCHTDPASEHSIPIWKSLFGDSAELFEAIVERGRFIRSYQRKVDESMARDLGQVVEFEGNRYLAVNARGANSQPYREEALRQSCDAILSYVWLNGKWIVSLYDCAGLDVGHIAKAYGGGGHAGAAGFQCTELPFKGGPGK